MLRHLIFIVAIYKVILINHWRSRFYRYIFTLAAVITMKCDVTIIRRAAPTSEIT